MQFVINTSLEPFGCALLSEEAVLDQSLWDDFKKVGEATWEFLEKHKEKWDQIESIGGISGPGGFSNLRVSGVILNALSLRLNLPIHQVRADKVVAQMLDDQDIASPFLLNSFSNAVFELQGTDLHRLELEEAQEKYKAINLCVDFLPEKKQKEFSQTISLDLGALYPCIVKVLKETDPVDVFVPDYEYPPVQK